VDRRRQPHVLAAISAAIGAAIPAAMMMHGALVLEIDYWWWTWFAVPIAALATVGSAVLAGRRPLWGGLLLLVTAAPAATIFWRELGIATFGVAWLLGGWIYFAAAVELGRTAADPEGAD
jgi:hypothetical protein